VGGRIIGLSTANGSGNFFHHLWTGASTGNNKFESMFFPWSATEDRGPSWYEEKKQSMLPWQLAQEYPTTPEEAFVRSGNPVFDLDVLDDMMVRCRPGLSGYLHELSPRSVEFRS
jgi:hypothetical protein